MTGNYSTAQINEEKLGIIPSLIIQLRRRLNVPLTTVCTLTTEVASGKVRESIVPRVAEIDIGKMIRTTRSESGILVTEPGADIQTANIRDLIGISLKAVERIAAGGAAV